MDSEKKWGCIGYALLALITWGLTQGFKVVCIIIGILIAILIAFIFISNLSTKRLIKKFKHQKDIYPNAYSFFRKEINSSHSLKLNGKREKSSNWKEYNEKSRYQLNII